MAYLIERFGSVVLPEYNRTSVLPPAAPGRIMVETVSGVVDGAGVSRARARFPVTLTITSTLSKDTAAAWRTAVDSLRAAVGTRELLYRRSADDEVHCCQARLMDMNFQRSFRDHQTMEMALTFAQLGPWLGKQYGSWILDDGEYFDTGLTLDAAAITAALSGETDIALANGGNVDVTAAKLTLTVPNGVECRQLTVVMGSTINWSYSVGAGDGVDGPATIVVHTGARSIKTGTGTDLYSGVSFLGHADDAWLRIPPGGATMTVTATTGATPLTIEYSEAWA